MAQKHPSVYLWISPLMLCSLVFAVGCHTSPSQVSDKTSNETPPKASQSSMSVTSQVTGPLNLPTPWTTSEFTPHDNWLGLQLNFEPAANLRSQVEKNLIPVQGPGAIILKNRGEAHITVITPIEYDVLKTHMNIKDIEKIALKQGLQKTRWTPVCVGEGRIKEMTNYFVVVKSPDLLRVRRAIETEFKKRAQKAPLTVAAGKFEAAHFYPHITLGFTERDLHEADGVIKDQKLCRWTFAKAKKNR